MEGNKDITPVAAKKTVAKKTTTAAKSAAKKTVAAAKPAAKKATTAKTTAAKKTTVKAKPVVAKAKTVAKKATDNVADVKAKVENTATKTKNSAIAGFKKVIETGVAAGGIVKTAGGIILDSSIQSTKAIAGIYKKAGKKALELGQNVIGETVMVAMKNQQKVVKTGKKALKDTVETIKDADLISNPLKKGKK